MIKLSRASDIIPNHHKNIQVIMMFRMLLAMMMIMIAMMMMIMITMMMIGDGACLYAWI